MHILLSAKTSCQHYIRKFNCHDSDTLVGDVRSGIHDIVFKLSSNAVTQAQGLICLCVGDHCLRLTIDQFLR